MDSKQEDWDQIFNVGPVACAEHAHPVPGNAIRPYA